MSFSIRDALDRLVTFEKAAWLAYTTAEGKASSADAVPRFYHTQESFPYWTNRVAPGTNAGVSEEFDNATQQILARLVLGHLDSGYEGENEDLLTDFIPYFVNYLGEGNRWALDTVTAEGTEPDPLDYLIEARVERWTGFTAFINSGIRSIQVGCEWTISLEYNDTLDR